VRSEAWGDLGGDREGAGILRHLRVGNANPNHEAEQSNEALLMKYRGALVVAVGLPPRRHQYLVQGAVRRATAPCAWTKSQSVSVLHSRSGVHYLHTMKYNFRRKSIQQGVMLLFVASKPVVATCLVRPTPRLR
jgi:hypothetical protein